MTYKYNASVTTGYTKMINALNFVVYAMIGAEFRDISTDGFKNTYLAPLDKVIKNLTSPGTISIK